ncbi:MAG: phosphoenolpyruvate carboxykinase (ATP) [Candidatus Magnetomorum sp.]|nr:phosphoenolpyruvate carboxykinase (ATP) [Candidatus Magnetomorum sp.]
MLKFKNGALDLVKIGKKNLRQVKRNYSKAKLFEEIIKNREGQISSDSAIVIRTGHAQEVSNNDLFIVNDHISEKQVCWGPKINILDMLRYETFINRLLSYMLNKSLYVQNCHVGSENSYQVPIRVVTENAWHSLFARNMFFPINNQQDPENYEPAFTVVHVPNFQSIPEIDGTYSQTAIIINMTHKVVIICGSCYSGNIRQAVFTMINYLMPHDIFPVQCAASMTFSEDVALFIGREGAGKTALAIDSQSIFIGDHAHGWTADGIFTYENGIYARVFGIDDENSPEINACSKKFGTILENASIDLESRHIDLFDSDLTMNTRASFTNTCLPHSSSKGKYAHPKNIFFVTCDSLGVLPPIIRISTEQAILGLLASFSSTFVKSDLGEVKPLLDFCFGKLALTDPPHVYAEKLHKKIKDHNIACWAINTGWSGRPYGEIDRIPIKYSRAAVRAVMAGDLENVDFETDSIFQYRIPKSCPGIPEKFLNPRNQADNITEYELRANRLVAEFIKDFSKYDNQIPKELTGMLISLLPFEDRMDYSNLGFSM